MAFALSIIAALIIFDQPQQNIVEKIQTKPVSQKPVAGSVVSTELLLAAYKNNPTDALGQKLAQALFTAAEYEDLLKYLSADPPILSNRTANALFRAEALTYLHRFDEALAVTNQLINEGVEIQYASLVLAKSHYGLGDFDATQKALLPALKAPPEIAGPAWMFRARIALDANRIAVALTARQRAIEIGVPLPLLEDIAIEAMLRSGEQDRALEALSPRLAAARADKDLIDIGAIRLKAMERAIAGDAVTAAREIDSVASWVKHESRGTLLRAVIKMRSGDQSQAEHLVRGYLTNAPDDWVALDLLLDVLGANASPKEAEALISRLTEANPLRGHLRRSDYERAGGSTARAAQSFREAASRAGDSGGETGLLASAVSFLLGPASTSSNVDETFLFDLGRLLNGRTEPAMATAQAIASSSDDPFLLLLAGDIALVSGDFDLATRAFDRGGKIAASDFVFVDRRVRVSLRWNNLDEATARLDVFLNAEPARSERVAARLLLSRIALHQDRLMSAKSYLSDLTMTELFSNDDAVIQLAVIFGRMNEAGPLESLCRESKRLMPGSLTQARLFVIAGKNKVAAKAYRTALLSAPDDVEAAAGYARLMAHEGRASEGAAFLRRLAGRKEQLPEIENILNGLVRLGEGGVERKIESAAVELPGPGDSAARKEALAVYSKAPASADALYYYGNLLPQSAASKRTGMLREACVFGAKGACAALKLE